MRLLFVATCLAATARGLSTSPAGRTAVANPAATASRIRVAHIQLETEEMAALCTAQLKAGTAFAELAESLSMCDSKGTGGELGWIAPGQMVEEFEAAAFSAPIGEPVTVETPFGWHVVRVAEASYVDPEMEPSELRERILAGDATASPPRLQLIDLRDDDELERAPLLPGFRHLPYSAWQTWAEEAIDGSLEPGFDRELELVFMDHRGGRGERMMQYFAQSGWSLARHVKGGINAYAEEADPSVPVYLESDGDCNTCHEH